MKIGIIGAGNIGADLAGKLSVAGHEVRIANSRGPDTLKDLAQRIGVNASTVMASVQDAELIVLSLPQKSIAELPDELFVDVPEDVVIIDTGNYYPTVRDGPIDVIEAGLTESGWVAQQIGRPVIKVFNSISAPSLAGGPRPAGAVDRIALPIAGDDARAKSIVCALVDAIGFDPVDAGSLDASWRQQPGTPAYCTDLSASELISALAAADREKAPHLRDEQSRKMGYLTP